MQQYVGVLMMSSIVTHGRNKKGKIIKTFKPHDAPFQVKVATSLKCTVDHYAIVSLQPIDCTKMYHQGEILELIGPVGDEVAERDYILAKHKLNFKPYSNTFTKKTFQDVIDACNGILEVQSLSRAQRQTHLRLNHKCIFSIDPPGCKDIDDCLSLEQHADKYVLGVHIADVTSFVPSQYAELLSNRPTSVYMDHKVINMLPDALIHHCSLLPNETRLAHSIFIDIPYKHDQMLSIYDLNCTILETVIVSKRAFTYQQVNNILTHTNTDKYKLHELNKLTASLNDQLCLPISSDPAHRIVETCMLIANALVGQHLYQTGCGMVARHHAASIVPHDPLIDESLRDHLIKMSSLAAQYTYVPPRVDPNTETTYAHAGLALTHYVHFTSPIRRYADIITHWLLKDIKIQVDQKHIHRINDTNTRIKRASREEKKLSIMYAIENAKKLGHVNDLVVDAFITHVNDGTMHVWIPKYDIVHSIAIRAQNQQYIEYTFNTTDTNNNGSISSAITITNNTTNTTVTLPLHQCLQVTIVPFPHQKVFNKKLNITINCIQHLYLV